jgi:primary-amine oxidase
LGPGFQIQGHVVEWQKWRFHVRSDQRVGAIVSTVTYNEGGRRRQILYEGHLSEMFVPYMDPSFDWRRRNFFDAGEFNAGGFAKPLIRGVDCPENSLYVDGLISGDDGRPKSVPNVLCLFEREAGDMAWRHLAEEADSRRKRDLVVRSAAVLGNYDYVFDWSFQQDGSLRVSVGATGIAEVKSSVVANAESPSPAAAGGSSRAATERADAYGRFVDQNLIAVNHDHYFNFRIDLDVDGPANSFLADRLVTRILPADNPRRSIWVREPALARTESEAMLHMDMDKPALWRVISPRQKNHVGYPTSYQLLPGMTAATLLSPDDYARRRAGFIDHHLWVTPYRYEERYAAGDYPTLSTAGQGLPAWTNANRRIEDTDIVLWYTIGMHHMVRGEDWPVMPVLWHSFELRPFDFFDRNPALDLPR